jgi:hypothetical protein
LSWGWRFDNWGWGMLVGNVEGEIDYYVPLRRTFLKIVYMNNRRNCEFYNKIKIIINLERRS